MAQLEPQEKVLVSQEFLSTVHGELSCVSCHDGDAKSQEKKDAHMGMEPHPSIKTPDKACGDCHGEIVATAKNSLHATLSTFPTIIKTRSDMSKWDEIDKARGGHCAGCHTSCGGCHVSRPKFAKKGFVKGHVFQKHSDPLNQCTSCHGSRIGNEFYGNRGQGDIHAAKYDMDCVSCHKAEEMHAAAPKDLKGRYHLKEMVRCIDCHKDLEKGSVRDHTIHIGKVQCQVCHSQSYVNCYSCHTGMDKAGLRYFQNQKEVEKIRIGLNYEKGAPGADYNYMLVRHIPADPDLFAHYVKDALTNFANTPNWKRASPHNIQRKTWQNASCNNCHGNRELFLKTSDLLDYEQKANKKVVVSDRKVPKTVKAAKAASVPASTVRKGMVVTAAWVEHNHNKGIKIIDARDRKSYDKGHIEGAVSLNPLAAGLRYDWNEDRPMQLVDIKEIASILGEAGLSANDHIVVYDKNGRSAAFLIWILEYAGASKVSYLDGGIEAWHEAGYHTSNKEVEAKETVFKTNVRPELKADNSFVAENLNNPMAVVLDARFIPQAKGFAKHDKASRGGHIPGSVNVPLSALYMENGYLKKPEELLWMLKANYNITPDKTVITTCNTGQLAADSYFVLRYLGFKDVRVHDESWISWCAIN
ncbi:MAG: rhodanese-like domain-containing protein [Desulfobulbaceae bacterium]|nr:rhodanese-like domain-containing protein [Desulfobulbaceae bacterium]